MNQRAVVLNTIIVVGFVVVIVRLADLMLFEHRGLAQAARRQHIVDKDIEVARGTIYDRRGREIAINIETESIYAEPRKIKDPDMAARALAPYTGHKIEELRGILSSGKGFAWVKRKMDLSETEKIKALEIEGIGFKPELKRFYPGGHLFSHVIGSVGVDNQPLEAIELKYDDVLKKPGGKVSVMRDARGEELSEGEETISKGNDIVLTIDEGLQYIVDTAIEAVVKERSASRAVAIMMNPFTGEILAMAGRPTYDSNNPSAVDASYRRNIAITDLYEPGSTFKIVAASAALEEGAVKVNSVFDCSRGAIKIGKHTITDAHRHGVLTFKEVIQKSSNVGFVNVGLRVGGKKLHSYARRFGFGERTGIDLPGEVSGWVSSGGSEISTASLSIGYAAAVTPLQVLRAYSAIANGGYLVKPYLVSEIRSPEGYTIYYHKEEPSKRVISKKTAMTLRELLTSVTEEGGTAKAASLDGNKVAGKTGTAMLREGRGYSKQKYASSFVGFVPVDDPKIALIVVVFEPKGQYYGGAVAAPVFKEIAEKTLAYLNIPRDDTQIESVFTVKMEKEGQ